MATTNKIKVHDIAKSFNLPSKDIMNILSEYSTPPKSHSAVMTEEEISIVFDYLTQKNQISSIEVIFADSFQAEAPAPAEKETAKAPQAVQEGTKPAAAGKPSGRQRRRKGPRTSRRLRCADDLPRTQDQDRGHPQSGQRQSG